MLQIVINNTENLPEKDAIIADGYCKNHQDADNRIGGYIIVKNNRIIEHRADLGGSNNLWELRAIYAALKYINGKGKGTIYTDSLVVMYWLLNGKVKVAVDKEKVQKGIKCIYEYIKSKKLNVTLKFWDQKRFGTIPADPKAINITASVK